MSVPDHSWKDVVLTVEALGREGEVEGKWSNFCKNTD